MQLQPSFSHTPNFKTLQNNGSSGSDWSSKVAQTIGDNPILFTADALDLGSGLANSLGGLQGAGGDVLKGTSVVMGGYHAIKAFYHLTNVVAPYSAPSQKHHVTMMTGEILSSAGQFCAAAGVGPVSLGFLGLGMVLTNAAQLSQ